MAGIRIKVGASLDSNALSVFQPLEKAAERARQNIQKNLNAGLDGRASVRTARTTGDALDRELEKAANKILRDEEKSQKDRTRLVARETKERTRLETQAAAAAVRSAKSAEREEARAKNTGISWRGGAIGIGRRAAISTSRRTAIAFGLGGRAIASGAGLAESLLSGMGVDLSMASHMANAQETQQRLVDVSNAGYIPGAAGAQGMKQDAGDIQKDVFKAADTGRFSHNDVAEGLQKFVGLTGDLDTGRKSLEAMARLSRATGANFADMEMAAGEVSNNLGDVPDKAAAIEQVMRVVAGQGKLGAVEIKDMARQMAKIATQAGKFEGGTAKNIGDLGILAQEAKLRGGATSATQAATSVASFAQDITKGTTLKHWAAAQVYNPKTKRMEGLSPFTDASKTTLRSPQELIMEALKYSKGDLTKIGSLFPNKMSVRAVSGFAQIYRDTGGDQKAKLEAVAAEFDHLRAAQLTAEEVQRAYTEATETSKSKVQLANNKLDEMAGKIQGAMIPALGALAPALEAMIPAVTSIVEGFGSILGLITQSTDKQESAHSQASESDALNYIGRLHRFEEHFTKNSAYGSLHPELTSASNMAAAAPFLDDADKRIGALQGDIGVSEGKVASEGLAFKGKSEKEIKDYAAGGGLFGFRLQAEATKYIADKASLDRLKATLDQVNSERTSLVDAMTSGKFTVTVANFPKPGPAPPSGGTSSPNSDGPDAAHE